MKASLQYLDFDYGKASFLSYWVKSEKFGFHWHYHPELEISYVKRGYGMRMVGDSVEEFEEGDLLLLGSGLPHTLVSNEMLQGNMELVVVQFPPMLLQQPTFQIPEIRTITKLCQEAERGLVFDQNLSQELSNEIEALPQLKGFERFHALLLLLNTLANADYKVLSSISYNPNKSSKSENRLKLVCNYIHENFTQDIQLEYLAELAYMNKASFCRFFKKMTGKTAVSYINDLRVNKASQMLFSENSISKIAYASGFNSLTHFHRVFLKKKGKSPLNYKKAFNV